MIRRLLISVAAVLAALLLGLIGAGALLTHTNAGARWLLERVAIEDWGGVRPESVEGNLSEGLFIPHLRLTTQVAAIEVESARLAVEVRWLNPRILVRRLDFDQVRIRMVQPATGGDRQGAGDIQLEPPLPIHLESLTAARVTLLNEEGQPLAPELTLSVQGNWAHRLDLAMNVESALAGWSMQLSGTQDLATPYAHDWAGSLQLDEALAGRAGLSEREYHLGLTGSTQSTRLALSSAAGGAQAEVELWPSRQETPWTAKLRLDQWALPSGSDGLAVVIADLAVQASGDGSDYELNGSAELQVDDLPRIETRIRGSGNRLNLDIESLSLHSPTFDAVAGGSLHWEDRPELMLEARLNRFDPSLWLEDWPADAPLRGQVALRWSDDTVEVSEGLFEFPLTGTTMSGSGTFNVAEGEANGRFEWRDLRWPLTGRERLHSRTAFFTVHGQADDWAVQGQIGVKAGDYPAAQLNLEATGSRTRSKLSLGHSGFLGGHLTGKADADWSGPLSWSARLLATEIDPSPLWPEWPGRLGLDFSVSQETASEKISIDLRNLAGTLRSQPVSGNGQIALLGGRPTFRELELRSGASRLRLDGDLDSGLDFDIDIRKSSILEEWVNADVAGSGRATFVDGQPRAELDLIISGLTMERLQADRITITGVLDPDAPGTELKAAASGLAFGNSRFERLEARLLTEQGSQRLGLRLEWSEQALELAAKGNIRLQTGSRTPAWKGQLEQLTWSGTPSGLFRLQHPASLDLSTTTARLDNFCLLFEPRGRTCLQAGWRQNGALRLESRFEGVPANVLTSLAGYEIQPAYELDGSFSWEHAFGHRPTGGANFLLSYRDAETGAVEPPVPGGNQGRFRFSLTDGELTDGELYLPFEEAGMAQLEFSIADLALDGSGKLEGRARVDLEDISILDSLLTGVKPVSGRFDVDARLGGRVAEPHLDGRVRLEHARLDIPALELSHVGLSLFGEVDRNDRMTLKGRVESGEGAADLDAEIDVSEWNDARLDLAIKGEGLTVVDVASLRILASPDLRLHWRQGAWHIDGSMGIPEARFSPQGSPIARIDESDDVEIVAGSLPDRPVARTRRPARVNGQMKLSLGDAVRIDMPAVKMAAVGDLDLTWKDAWLPQASGQLLLNGEIRTFGPRLVVENGPVRFANRPVDDPALDIRAERDIYGNTQIRSAGVHVRGTAKRPLIEAYTVPLTNEDRAWALLVTGSDFDYGQGIGAFDIGTYIAPRLYISYGINLFGDERAVSARYDLRKGFGVKATASEEGNGVDASFTVER